jgi:hypothetical protein
MLNILGHKGNANQNDTKISPHSVRIAIINYPNNNKCWGRSTRGGTLIHSWWECKLVKLLWKKVWRFLKKLKI